ncbi:MAG: insulinase family protein [Chlorobi bacterium]|nr:insulinase family protein [Chlorobiota bacterium]
MISINKFELENGLRVIVHKDTTTPIVAFNILYDVGARDENENKTGFAHLFEHLMFGGSENIPNYDSELQKTGGENNAFTTNNVTNYYLTLPKQNLETAFWLESDRMLALDFSEEKLRIQKNVVIEEYKQRYLNQPYGDVWLLLRPLAYKVHPYKWATIGKNISHIENADLNDVKSFFYHHYAPNNAIISVAGDVNIPEIERLANKWFGKIERRDIPLRNLPVEPEQTSANFLEVKRNVPFDAIYKAFHMCDRKHKDFYATDLISDLLSNGRSSRLNQSLIKEKKMFSEVNAYITGDIDNGLFIVTGKLMKGIKMKDAEHAINEELNKLRTEIVPDNELNKIKNKIESMHVFSEISVLNKAMNLAQHELLGDAKNINKEVEKYRLADAFQIHKIANKLFRSENSSTLYYKSAQ